MNLQCRDFDQNAGRLVARVVVAILLYSSHCDKAFGADPDVVPVEIQYFYEAGCQSCLIISNQVLPALKDRYGDFYALKGCDVGIQSNYMNLVRWQEKLHIIDNEQVCMILDGRFALVGLDMIRTGLFERLDQCIEERAARSGTLEPVVPERKASRMVLSGLFLLALATVLVFIL